MNPRAAADYLRLAMAEAEEAARAGNRPYGAVIVGPDGQLAIAERNRVTELSDPSAHAEMMAIRRLCAERRTLTLEGHRMFASAHPCPMCFAVILDTRFAELHYAAPAPPGIWPPGSEEELARRYGHPIRIFAGTLADEARAQLERLGR